MATTITAADGTSLSLDDAEALWEGGEFSSWADRHGWPVEVDGDACGPNDIEDALSAARTAAA